MKYLINVVIWVVSIFCCMLNVRASDDGIFLITNESAMKECLEKESMCRLGANITSKEQLIISHDLILDLNGKSIQADPNMQLKNGLIIVNRGAKLTINDSKGTGLITTGKNKNVYAAIGLIKDVGTELAELEVNGGTLEGYYYGIVGNGNNHNTKITINDGTIKGLNQEDSAGIYQPQHGDIVINNGNISGGTGIEIRSGTLTVNNGNIEGIASKFVKMVNKSGTTTNGVGIAVAQHTTKNPIQVAIHNGKISGQYAFYEWNPHNNQKSDLDKIDIQISGGTFDGTAQGVSTIYSQDFKKFVSGGKFNKDVTEYVKDGATVTSKINETSESVFKESEKQKKSFLFPFLIGIIIIGLSAGGLLFCKKQKLFWFQ